MTGENIILIVATSGRMLAQMVRNCGFYPVVIDCFADQDTQRLAIACIKVDSLALKSLQPAFSTLQKKFQITRCLYGSGFETYLDSLAFIQRKIVVLGNSVEIFSSVQNKVLFFETLKKLNIPHPYTLFNSPKNNLDFLVKPLQGEGGIGIKTFQDIDDKTQHYFWQQKISGESLSVLFIANGKQWKIYGFHQQLVRNFEVNDYIFSGLISLSDVSEEVVRKVSYWVSLLVNEFSLIGLNSMDFIVQNEQCFVLEINPRPSASIQLYPSAIIEEHMECCISGKIDSSLIDQPFYHAYQIIFSTSDFIVKTGINWPKWAVDLPLAGSIIYTGMPICSIIAGKKSKLALIGLLQLRQQLIEKLLK